MAFITLLNWSIDCSRRLFFFYWNVFFYTSHTLLHDTGVWCWEKGTMCETTSNLFCARWDRTSYIFILWCRKTSILGWNNDVSVHSFAPQFEMALAMGLKPTQDWQKHRTLSTFVCAVCKNLQLKRYNRFSLYFLVVKSDICAQLIC